MIELKNVKSLSDFQRNTRTHVRRLQKSGKPQVLTIKGEAQLVVQSAEGYQKLVNDSELARTLEVLQRSIAEADAGKGVPMKAFLERLGRRHGIKLRTT